MAVYTHVGESDLKRFLAGYNSGEAISLKEIAEGIENTNYLLETTAGKFILTLFEKRVAPHDLPFFMALTSHLSDKGLPVANPVRDSSGNVLTALCGKPAALIEFLTGRSRMEPTIITCEKLGGMLGRLHTRVQDFNQARDNSLSLSGWRDLAKACHTRADECAPELANTIATELAWLEANQPAACPRGIIHADLFPDNVLFTGDEITGVIDFYFACTDAFVYDLAICLNAWCFDNEHYFNPGKAHALVGAYQRIRPLSDIETDALPYYLRGASMRFLLTRLFDWLNQVEGANVKIKDPLENLAKLRFHQHNNNLAQYGLA